LFAWKRTRPIERSGHHRQFSGQEDRRQTDGGQRQDAHLSEDASEHVALPTGCLAPEAGPLYQPHSVDRQGDHQHGHECDGTRGVGAEWNVCQHADGCGRTRSGRYRGPPERHRHRLRGWWVLGLHSTVTDLRGRCTLRQPALFVDPDLFVEQSRLGFVGGGRRDLAPFPNPRRTTTASSFGNESQTYCPVTTDSRRQRDTLVRPPAATATGPSREESCGCWLLPFRDRGPSGPAWDVPGWTTPRGRWPARLPR
jgi:hypothetical protein